MRGSKNVKEAKNCLVNGDTGTIKFRSAQSKKRAAKLDFTERQAAAILEMRLYRLIGLEIEALWKDHQETLQKIALYEDLLSNRESMKKLLIKELRALKKEYGRQRRTVIDNVAEAVYVENKIEEKDVAVLIDRFGYARSMDVALYERNKEAADSESKDVFLCKNTDRICIFTNKGQLHMLKVLDLPYGKFRDKGQPIDNVSNYDSSQETCMYLTPLSSIIDKKLLFGTAFSMLKQVSGAEFDVSKRTTAATKLTDGDEVLLIRPLSAQADEEAVPETVVMQSEKGMFLRIEAASIPEKKKTALGVRGMRLAENDRLTHIYLLDSAAGTVEAEYEPSNVVLNRLRVASRDTKGVKR